MSRYVSGEFEYGYDFPLQEYFLQRSIDSDEFEFEELVGSLSDTHGNASNMLAAIEAHGVIIPEDHREKIMMDLPF